MPLYCTTFCTYGHTLSTCRKNPHNHGAEEWVPKPTGDQTNPEPKPVETDKDAADKVLVDENGFSTVMRKRTTSPTTKQKAVTVVIDNPFQLL